jgi:hypothetical protein
MRSRISSLAWFKDSETLSCTMTSPATLHFAPGANYPASIGLYDLPYVRIRAEHAWYEIVRKAQHSESGVYMCDFHKTSYHSVGVPGLSR